MVRSFPAAWALLLLLALTAGCDGHAPGLEPLGPEAVILAFGDSLTYGTGSSAPGISVPARAYPHQLELLCGRKVINAGRPGETSAEGLIRLPRELDRWHPDLVLLCHGGNDLLKRLPKEQLRSNLGQMIARIRSAGAQVALIGVPSPGLVLRTETVYHHLAEDMDVPLEPQALPDILADEALKSDMVHPNSVGYRTLALRILAFLQDSGALPRVDDPARPR